MTEFEIASAIQNYVTSHSGVTDSPISLRQIRDEVDTLRLRLLDELFRSQNTVVDITPFIQSAVFTVNRNKSGVSVEIPQIYYKPDGKLAAPFIGSGSQNTPYKIATGNRRLWASHDLYTGKAPIAVYQEGLLTFKNVVPKSVYVEAVFNKPRELSKYGYDWRKSQYPVPYGLIDNIIGKTAESYLRTMRPVMPVPNTQSDQNVQGIQQTKQA